MSADELDLYHCHKCVRAAKIVGVEWHATPKVLTLIGGQTFEVSAAWLDRHSPSPGGYLVCYKDGHQSYSPAEAFEEGYTLIGPQGEQMIDVALTPAVIAEAYSGRNIVVHALCSAAMFVGWRCGLGKHSPEGDPDWNADWHNVVYIDLPTGQVSWRIHDSELPVFSHLPRYTGKWDGHTSAEKTARIASLRTSALEWQESNDQQETK